MARALIERALEQARIDPTRTAVRSAAGDRMRTRADVITEARRLAAELDRTTEAGATILVQGPSGAGFHAAVLAIWGSGRRALPIGPLNEADVMGLITAHRPGARIVTEAGHEPTGRSHLPILEASFEPSEQLGTLDRGEHASLLLQSSGTIGRPRVSLREALAIDRVAATLHATIGLTEEDRVLSALPMHHAYGIEHAVMLPILAGSEVIQMPKLEIDVATERLVSDATVLPAVPPTIDALASSPVPSTSLRLAYTAGSPLPVATRERFESVWGVKVGDLYGASEVGTITWGLDGRTTPVRGVDVQLADDGELMVRSDAMFVGYLDDSETAPCRERIAEGWFLTGDLARIEEDGTVELIGRARLQFDVGGLKVNPNDVEDVLREHPAVVEVMVSPLPLSETVNRVQARIVTRPDHEGDEAAFLESLRKHARAHLPPHQVPRRIEIVDALPRTPSGKLIRSQPPVDQPA